MEQGLQQAGVVRYLSTNQLLMHSLVKDFAWMMYGTQPAELNVWIVTLLAFCNLHQRGRIFFAYWWCEGAFYVRDGLLRDQLATTTLSMTKESSLASLPIVSGAKRRSLVRSTVVTPFCVLLSRCKKSLAKLLRIQEVYISPD